MRLPEPQPMTMAEMERWVPVWIVGQSIAQMEYTTTGPLLRLVVRLRDGSAYVATTPNVIPCDKEAASA